MEIGSIAELVSAIFSIGFGIVSLFVAVQANKRAEQANKRVEESARLAERNTLGAVLQVWWAKRDNTDDESKEAWGLVILNSTENYSTVHKVIISYHYMDYEQTYKIDFLPSGIFFLKNSNQKNNFPEVVKDISQYEPIIKSSSHKVDSVEFSTADTRRWYWTPANGVRELSQG